MNRAVAFGAFFVSRSTTIGPKFVAMVAVAFAGTFATVVLVGAGTVVGTVVAAAVDDVAALGLFLLSSLLPSVANRATTIANNATSAPTRTAVLRWRWRRSWASRA